MPEPVPAFTRAATLAIKPADKLAAALPGSADSCTTAALIAAHAGQAGALLPLLHAIQDKLGFIAPGSVGDIAQALNLSRAEVHGVITYYPHFRTVAPARHTLEVCRAESCQALGGDALAAHVQQRLGCDFHGADASGAVGLEAVYCLGLCAQSPAVAIDGVAHARMTPARMDRLLDPLLAEAAKVDANAAVAQAQASSAAAPRNVSVDGRHLLQAPHRGQEAV
ncbi:formate dehydrogenase subunit gamma [Pigmentiphaga aceris]|uniref:Formate dehydrogenase subunit gamma n=1 Tax=Pigmentiphaga aceris TaxID=1940612 RepID=A0A5C0B2V0_9BURK|nr:formate dehydrogenase subunit gamma [Pigmentiphaga aceris]